MKHGLPVRALETLPLWGFRQVESVSTSFQFSFCLIPNILVHFCFSLAVLIKCFDKTTQGNKHSDSQFRDVVHHNGEIKVTKVWSNYSVTFTAGKWWCPVLIFHSVQHPSQRMAPPTFGQSLYLHQYNQNDSLWTFSRGSNPRWFCIPSAWAVTIQNITVSTRSSFILWSVVANVYKINF